MCDRTIKMKLKKGSILNEVNSNTNSIELTVYGLDRLKTILQVMGVQPTKSNIERYSNIIKDNADYILNKKNVNK
jgi:hypothetical protein